MGIHKSSKFNLFVLYSVVAIVVFLFEGEGEENTVKDKGTSVSPDIRRAEQVDVILPLS